MTIHIEKLKTEDYPLIPDLYAHSFQDDPWPTDWYDIPQFNPDSNWIASWNGRPCGFLISFLSNDLPYISVLATHKDFQRKGVGARLLQEALAYWKAKGYNTARIHVERKRVPAIALYSKFGFRVLGVEEGSFLMGVLVMDI